MIPKVYTQCDQLNCSHTICRNINKKNTNLYELTDSLYSAKDDDKKSELPKICELEKNLIDLDNTKNKGITVGLLQKILSFFQKLVSENNSELSFEIDETLKSIKLAPTFIQTIQPILKLTENALKVSKQINLKCGKNICPIFSTTLITTKKSYQLKLVQWISEKFKLEKDFDLPSTDEWKEVIQNTNKKEINNPVLSGFYLLNIELQFYHDLFDALKNTLEQDKIDLSELIYFILSRFTKEKQINLSKIPEEISDKLWISIPGLEIACNNQVKLLSLIVKFFEFNQKLSVTKHIDALFTAFLMTSDILKNYNTYMEKLEIGQKNYTITQKEMSRLLNKNAVSWKGLSGSNNIEIGIIRDTILFDKINNFIKTTKDNKDINPKNYFITPFSFLFFKKGGLDIVSYDNSIKKLKDPISSLSEWILSINQEKNNLPQNFYSTIYGGLKLKMLSDSYWLALYLLKLELEKDLNNDNLVVDENLLNTENEACKFIQEVLDLHLFAFKASEKGNTLLNEITDLYIKKLERKDSFVEKLYNTQQHTLDSHWSKFRWGQLLIPESSFLLTFKTTFGFDFCAQVNKLLKKLSSLELELTEESYNSDESVENRDNIELALLKYVIDNINEKLSEFNYSYLKSGSEKFIFGKILKSDIQGLKDAFKSFYSRYSKIEPPSHESWWLLISTHFLAGVGNTLGIATLAGFTLFRYSNPKEIKDQYDLACLGYNPGENIKELFPESLNPKHLGQIIKDLKKLTDDCMGFAEQHPHSVEKFIRQILITINTFSSKDFFEKFKNVMLVQMYTSAALRHLGNSYETPINRMDFLKIQALCDLAKGRLSLIAGASKALINFFKDGITPSISSLIGIPVKAISTTIEPYILEQVADLLSPNAEIVYTFLKMIDGDYNHIVETHSRLALLKIAAQLRHAFFHPEDFKAAWKVEFTIWMRTLSLSQSTTEKFFRSIVQVGGPLLIVLGTLNIIVAIFMGSIGIWLGIPLLIAFPSYGTTLILKGYSIINTWTSTREKVETTLLGEAPYIRLQCEERVKEVTSKFFSRIKEYNPLLDLTNESLKMDEQTGFLVKKFSDRWIQTKQEELSEEAIKLKLDSPKDLIKFFKEQLKPDHLKKRIEQEFELLLENKLFTEWDEDAKKQLFHHITLQIIRNLEGSWLQTRVESKFVEELLLDLKNNGKNASFEESVEKFDREQKKLFEDLDYAPEFFESKLATDEKGRKVDAFDIKQALEGFKRTKKAMKAI
jgi:hypothetical protein